MKKFVSVLAPMAFAWASVANAQTAVITLHHQGVSSMFYIPTTTLEDVINIHASPGDTIVMPGGIIPFTSFTMDKSLTIVGAGFHQNGVPVTQKTIIPYSPNGLILGPNSDNTSIHGIDFESPVSHANGADNISFTRCEFSSASLYQGNGPHPTGITFRHCVFRSAVLGGFTQGSTFLNCIFQEGIGFSSAASNVLVEHCLVMSPNLGSNQTSQAVTYRHNLFVINGSAATVNNLAQFQNNFFAFTQAPGALSWGGANQSANGSSANAAGQFVSAPSFSTFEYNYNYHLNTGAGGIAANHPTLDQTEVGIYGGLGNDPWKELAIPFNPHWDLLVVPGSTSNGQLTPVQIGGSAQPH